MGEIIVDILLFLLILISYYFILKTVFDTPFVVMGVITGIIARGRGFPVAAFTRIEAAGIAILSIAFLVSAFAFNYWPSEWLRIWTNPILLGILLLMSVIMARFVTSSNPTFRNVSAFAAFAVWPVFLLILVGATNPGVIKQSTFQWAVTIAGVLVILAAIWSFSSQPRDLELFEEINARHSSLTASLQQLHQVADLIGDTENWKTIREAMDRVNRWAALTYTALQNGKYQEAETLLMQAETETAQVEGPFYDRIRLSLKDELKTRLTQAISEISELEKEFQAAGLDPANLSQLSTKIHDLEDNLDTLALDEENLTAADLLDKLRPFERTLREIVETRTSLRFRQNLGSSIDLIHQELAETLPTVQICRGLGLKVSELTERENRIASALQAFQSVHIHTSGDLVDLYNDLQKTLAEFRGSVRAVKARIDQNWSQEVLHEGIFFYRPKQVSTSELSLGLVVIQSSRPISTPVKVEISGISLELPTVPSIEIRPDTNINSFGMKSFKFRGKSGGQASLTLKATLPNQEITREFDFLVHSSRKELIQDAFVMATPTTAVVMGVLWISGTNLGDAASLGAAVGSAVGLLFLTINMLSPRLSRIFRLQRA